MDMIFERKLAVPAEVKEMYPLTPDLSETVKRRDAELKSILSGEDDRLILVIGPCSADREDSVIDYITRLRGVQEKVKNEIFIIPRIYTNKPRTTGDGYKGMLHQPDPGEKPDMFKGIVAIRELHMRALRETGFSCAD
ncbi:MAG: 3-deoxy-7-phosphoheptulonate synthase, partial [Clostridia bacterium]|nr:3-deoxy-7-phosphoheptulonate synthase [Clostridia bacterium]